MLTDFHANGSYENIAKHFKLLDIPDYAYMVRTTDLEKEDYITDVKYVSKSCYEYLAKSKVYGGEVLINKIGSPGLTYLMPSLNKPVSLGMNLFMLRMKYDSVINNVVLYLFLNSRIGKSIITRVVNGTVPLTIDKESIKSILVPVFSNSFQLLLSQLIEKRNVLLKQSYILYTKAEDILNKELNITNIENTKPYSIRSFSNSFGKSKRLDAEYYQDKYDQIVNRLKTKLTLSNICHIYDENFNPLEKGIYKYVELSDIYSNGEIREPTEYFGNELPTRARRKIDNGQVLVSSIEGSLSSCALVTDYDSSNLICSNGFYVVDSDTINSETLLVLFKSQYIQMLLKQRCSGTILTAISDDEFKNLPFIQIDAQVQDKIAQKVQESFRLRKQSKDLLEKAVKAVDLAIEQGEEKAIAWLNENTSE